MKTLKKAENKPNLKSKVSYFLYKNRKYIIVIICVILFLSIITNEIFSANKTKTVLQPNINLVNESPSIDPSSSDNNSDFLLVSQKPLATITTTNTTPISTPKPTYLPSPVLTPNLNISYPSENQEIVFNDTSQTLCVVDVPISNTQGLQKRQNINNQGWNNYANNYSTCFKPIEGTNTFQLQYKNSSGGESSIYTRSFKFRFEQNLTITVYGNFYSDLNCNDAKDSNESFITNINTIGYLFKQPENSIYVQENISGGSYRLSKNVSNNDVVTVKVNITAPSGYKIHISNPTFTLSKTSSNYQYDWPLVPNEKIGSCQN